MTEPDVDISKLRDVIDFEVDYWKKYYKQEADEYVAEQLNKQVDEKDLTISQKGSVVENDLTILQRMSAIIENDLTILQRMSAIIESDLTILQLQSTIEEKDNEIRRLKKKLHQNGID